MAETDALQPSSDSLRLELLGSTRLLRGEAVVQTLERRDAALLAMLAIEGPTSRSRLATLLWPDRDAKHGNNNLRQRLFRLRRSAARDVVIGDSLLALSPAIDHDLNAFAERAALDAGRAVGELLGTIDYTDCGDLSDWVDGARAQWRAARRQVLAETASRLESEGRIAKALAFAERLVLDDPTAEHAHRRVMRLHYLRGDRAAALAAFERCSVLLKRELKAQPGSETLQLAAIIERSGVLPDSTPAPKPVTVLRPPRLVGRSDEWQAIESAWQQGRVVLVSGEPGIGKTRLLSDYAFAHGGVQVVGARPGDASVPYGVLARVLRNLLERFGRPATPWALEELARLLPELGAEPTGPLQTLRLHDAVRIVLQEWSAHADAALVIDDLQFADGASLECVLAAASATFEHTRWLLAVRANERPAALVHWIGDSDGSRLTELVLRPLDRAGVAQLLESLAIPGLDPLEWVDPIARHTGGNPMFILETLIAMLPAASATPRAPLAQLPIPAHVGQLIDRRLQQLAAPALRLAQLAALAGPDFSVALAARVLGVHALDLSASWRELEAAQVIRNSAFAHDLILEATLRSVPGPIASQLHDEIASVAEALDAPPARIAGHWLQAGQWQRAAVNFERAAQAAAAASRRDEELRLWEQASECFEQAQAPSEAFRTRLRSIDAAIVVEPMAQAQQRVSRLIAESLDDDQRVDAWLAQAKLTLTGGDGPRGYEAATTAFDLARARRPHGADAQAADERELNAVHLLGTACTLTSRMEKALQLFDSYKAAAEAATSERLRLDFNGAYGYVLGMTDRRRESIVVFETAIGIAEQRGDFEDAMVLLGNVAGQYAEAGDPERALRCARRSMALRERLGVVDGVPAAASRLNVGIYCSALGRYGEAQEAFVAALEQFRAGHAGVWVVVTQNHLAGLYIVLGQAARARQTMAPVDPGAGAGANGYRRVLLECRLDRLAERPVLQRLLDAHATLPADGRKVSRFQLELAIAPELEPQDSVGWCERLRAEALACEHDAIAIHALVRHADALRRCGRLEESAAAAQAAIEQVAGCIPYDMYRAEFWWLASQALNASGHADAALEALRSGVQWVQQQALPHVPEAFRDSFLQRNPVNRAMLTTAARVLAS